MKFVLEIELGGSKESDLSGTEVCELLAGVGRSIPEFLALMDIDSIRDVNGNRVGEWRVE